jgi:beta-glucosidase
MQPEQIEARVEQILSSMTLPEKCALLAGKTSGATCENERLKVPSIHLTDSPHGVRLSSGDLSNQEGQLCTTFPTGSAGGATWDTELVERVGRALGEEARGKGGHVLLGPTMNIIRTPLGGRSFESFSEDPFHVGAMASAYVRGLQSMSVGACPKHFCCNNQEQERFRNNSVLDERTLREIYLAGFEHMFRHARPWSTMCAYNRVNGTYMAENRRILREILKNQWGFDGVVVSDWGACHSTAASVEGGLDLEMPGPGFYYDPTLLADQVENGQLDVTWLDDAARRMLRLVLRTTDHDDRRDYRSTVNSPEHQQLAREYCEQAIVLLKNDNNSLPLETDKLRTLAVLGPNAETTFHSGGGSSCAKPPYVVSVLEGLGQEVGQATQILHEPGCDNYTHMRPPLPQQWVGVDEQTPGLRAEYFDNSHLRGEAFLTEIVPTVNCWWCRSRPPMDGPYSVRFSGILRVQTAGEYYFGIDHTCQVRLTLDDACVLDDRVKIQSPEGYNSVVSTRFDLEADRDYRIVLELQNPTVQMYPHCKLMAARFPTEQEQQEGIDRAVRAAREADVAVVVVGGMRDVYETEGKDRPSLLLPGLQNELISAVADVNANTVVVINTGAPVAMPWLEKVSGVVQGWYGGLEVGRAIARVLTGKVNPSGKLPMTFPRRIEDTPAFEQIPGASDVQYGEGIFVGYRWYDARDIEPLFPFGHGLSYTSFEYSDLQHPQVLRIGEELEVYVTVTNTGARPGAEVVQLYLSDLECRVACPVRQLKGFAKVYLEPGRSKRVRFGLEYRDLAYWDTDRGAWRVDPGNVEIAAAASSRDIRLTSTMQIR